MKRDLQYCMPSLGQSWVMACLVLVGSLIFGAVLPGKPMSITYFLAMVVLPFLYAWLIGRKARLMPDFVNEAVPLNKPFFSKINPVLCFVLAIVAMVCMSVVMEPLYDWIPMPDNIQEIFKAAFIDTPTWDAILSTCIMAPILEETLCRGLMLRGMLKTKAPWKAILWSAFIFAFMHLNPWQAIPAFVMGCFFGWLYCRTRCLWLTIVLHCVNNSLSTALTRLLPDVSMDTGFADLLPHGTYIATYIVSLVLFVAIFLILDAKTVSSETKTDS